jgi:hypothetical protein
MKKLLKLATIMLILTGIFGSCKENNAPTMDDNSFGEYLKSAPYIDVSKENLPKWLVDRINETEAKPVSTRGVQIYKGEWNKQTVYFIMDTFSSCLCDFYTEDGEGIDNLSDLRTTSKNRILIYKYGESV